VQREDSKRCDIGEHIDERVKSGAKPESVHASTAYAISAAHRRPAIGGGVGPRSKETAAKVVADGAFADHRREESIRLNQRGSAAVYHQ